LTCSPLTEFGCGIIPRVARAKKSNGLAASREDKSCPQGRARAEKDKVVVAVAVFMVSSVVVQLIIRSLQQWQHLKSLPGFSRQMGR
jgi:hypothetical protein